MKNECVARDEFSNANSKTFCKTLTTKHHFEISRNLGQFDTHMADSWNAKRQKAVVGFTRGLTAELQHEIYRFYAVHVAFNPRSIGRNAQLLDEATIVSAPSSSDDKDWFGLCALQFTPDMCDGFSIEFIVHCAEIDGQMIDSWFMFGFSSDLLEHSISVQTTMGIEWMTNVVDDLEGQLERRDIESILSCESCSVTFKFHFKNKTFEILSRGRVLYRHKKMKCQHINVLVAGNLQGQHIEISKIELQ